MRATWWIAIAGVLAVAAYAAFAALQILVLNPLAATPGKSLEQIRSEASAVGEPLGGAGVLVFLGVGVLLAVILAVVVIRSRIRPVVTALLFLGLLAFGTPAYFAASFGPGMSLADAFGISGADYSPWSLLLYGISALAVVMAVVLAVVLVLAPRDRVTCSR
ncbi:hypothetical protein GCM10025768_05390 [Microbacterium pseudoresistens]